jgi:hypothetical protein
MLRSRHLAQGFAAALAVGLAGCARQSGAGAGDSGYADPASKYAGLAFATVDARYQSSELVYNDFGRGRRRPLSTGESGDPALFWLGESLFLFNRSATSLNFRQLDPRTQPTALSPQLATPGAAVGDPHAALLLDPHRLLLALYDAGKLVVVDPTTGVLAQTVDAAWDLGGGANAQLRPAALKARDLGDGTREIYVLHQGYDKTLDLKGDGSQAVFVLKDDGQTLTAVDLDAVKDGVQGLPLSVRAPAAFFPGPSDDHALIYGECSSFDTGACVQGFVDLAMTTRTMAPLWDTGALGLKGNGGIVHGSGPTYYELMVEAGGTKVVERLDLDTRTATELYRFKGESGCCALYFDDSSGTLYVGDQTRLEVFPAPATSPRPAAEVELDGIAYAGAFVPK